MIDPRPQPDETLVAASRPTGFWTEDLLAILIGWTILLVSLFSVQFTTTMPEDPTSSELPTVTASHALDDFAAKPGKWSANPLDAFGGWEAGLPDLIGSFGAGVLILGLFALGLLIARQKVTPFLGAFPIVFLLALLAYVLAGQALIKAYNLEYALWALSIGLAISNTVGVPGLLRGAMRTEFYIKTGLVLLGSEILMSRLLALGLPGVFVAWVVTPIVLVSTYWFGQRILKMPSKSLNMVIASDMSVCGVSAAIASAAACKAKKEELSLAIGMSLSFTVVMMVAMPAVIKAVGMDEVLGGAWMGGTIDATGAVVAAGEFLGPQARDVAATIKMIQNILIGVVALGIATFWTTVVERDSGSTRTVGVGEIWKRFPKFILGFIAASILFSFFYSEWPDGELLTSTSIGFTKTIRGWLFCLAFVSIGLETNYAEIKSNLKGGKPLILYVCGQSLNLILTLAMAYLMFKVVFPDAAG